MKVLHLTLKKKWFDMIASGEKTEEYREATDFILPRLLELTENFLEGTNRYTKITGAFWFCVGFKKGRENAVEYLLSKCARWRQYDCVTFQNGYQKNAARITFRFRGVCYSTGIESWGAEPDEKYFTIKLGEKL